MKTQYRKQSFYSDPGIFDSLIREWSLEPIKLSKSISDFVFHVGSIECQRVFSSETHLVDMRARTVVEILQRVVEENQKLPNRKLAGVCRDFSLLAVSAFRSRGVPARLRVGFANYFTKGFWEDHWLCEYYNEGRWHLLDVEVAAEPSIAFERFNPTSVPDKYFVKAPVAWRLLQSEKVSSKEPGVHRLGITGEWFAAANVFRDAAALSRVELKPWDYWGVNSKFDLADDKASNECRSSATKLAKNVLQFEENLASNNACEEFKDWLPQSYITSYPDGQPERTKLP